MLLDQLDEILVVLGLGLVVEVGGLDGHRAVEEDVLGVEIPSRQLRQVVEDLLVRPSAKAGMITVPPRRRRRRMTSRNCASTSDRLMRAVAVGRFQNQSGRSSSGGSGSLMIGTSVAAHVAGETPGARSPSEPLARISTEAAPSRWPARRNRTRFRADLVQLVEG